MNRTNTRLSTDSRLPFGMPRDLGILVRIVHHLVRPNLQPFQPGRIWLKVRLAYQTNGPTQDNEDYGTPAGPADFFADQYIDRMGTISLLGITFQVLWRITIPVLPKG